ncbi:MAG TPA: primosomal protein N' [Bacillota bacterium]|nr:primosomal protein N' [Bacillota bacterium]
MKQRIARVLIDSHTHLLDRLFDYRIPETMDDRIQIGARVIAPFQNQSSLAYVWEISEESEYSELKSIQQLVDEEPLISPVQYHLINWLAGYYFCSRPEIIRLCFPPGGNLTKIRSYGLNGELEKISGNLSAAGFPVAEVTTALELLAQGAKAEWNQSEWQKKFETLLPVWEFLVRRRLLIPLTRIAGARISPKFIRTHRWISEEITDQTSAGKRVRDVLLGRSQGMTTAELAAAAEVSVSVLTRLTKQGKLVVVETPAERVPAGFEPAGHLKRITFTPDQAAICQQILQGGSKRPFLLHGITGSGKTEIYFEIAAGFMQQDNQVLYLVPEIALTPQTLERARNRFGDQVALIHSNLGDGERFDQWYKIKNGTARFVLGARSALFAPFSKLGLIIVDEEHETTYKQEETPRYHARQVVEKMAELTGAQVIFGSATPSIESFYFSQTGKYHYLYLGRRFNSNPLPEVAVVDMRAELQTGNKNILSKALASAIQESLAHKEQIILLLNRRGYATFILCRDCGLSLKCSSCDVALTYHLHDQSLRCHYCDYRGKVPAVCPSCGSSRIRYFGNGTQRLEEELALKFPEARLIRMDLDSTSKKGAHVEIYRRLQAEQFDILLGTQMIAKGLDLPRVTLVGVISADSTLNLPDFRSSERTFHLLTQVAGRAGRGQVLGRVIFQTYNPDHYALLCAQNHDYGRFYEQEIANRREVNFPPFSELAKFGLSGLEESQVSAAATELALILNTSRGSLGDIQNPGVEILGPAPCVIPKVQDKYRWQILLKAAQANHLEDLVKTAWSLYPFRKYPGVKVIKDRNPYSII